MTIFNQSECFISVLHCYATLKFVYDIGSWISALRSTSELYQECAIQIKVFMAHDSSTCWITTPNHNVFTLTTYLLTFYLIFLLKDVVALVHITLSVFNLSYNQRSKIVIWYNFTWSRTFTQGNLGSSHYDPRLQNPFVQLLILIQCDTRVSIMDVVALSRQGLVVNFKRRPGRRSHFISACLRSHYFSLA